MKERDDTTCKVRASAYRRGVLVLSLLALCMGAGTLIFLPGLRPDQWVAGWSIWALVSAMLCALVMGRHLLRDLLPHILPSLFTNIVFTASVLIFGGKPIYLIFMWGIFLGLGLLASRSVLPERAALHGWVTLIAALAASMGSFFVPIDSTLLALFLFAAIPLATASRK